VAHYYAKHLAIAIWEKHYKDTAPDWRPLPDLMGVLTQIDNMAVGLAPPRREAQQEQEPVAWGLFAETDGEWQLQYPVFVGDEFGKRNAEAEAAACNSPLPIKVRPLFTHPPRREWQSLTDEEIDAVAADLGYAQLTPREVARAIEQALKEKNHD
jgi:hypothetical protein